MFERNLSLLLESLPIRHILWMLQEEREWPIKMIKGLKKRKTSFCHKRRSMQCSTGPLTEKKSTLQG